MLIGHVCKTHGLNGQFTIKLCVPIDLCPLFTELKIIYIENTSTPLEITNSVLSNTLFLKTKLKNINNREEAKLILRKNITIREGDHTNIDKAIRKKNEFVNFKMIDRNVGEIGIVTKIDFNRPQSLLFVKNENKKILIPYVKDFIINVNKEKQELNVDLPDGIVDICGE
tara:strand:+ start:240 stop:749 length:510 start_codon:yes stop_codon:yes gene_type:complete